jgi:hypothetical protein
MVEKTTHLINGYERKRKRRGLGFHSSFQDKSRKTGITPIRLNLLSFYHPVIAPGYRPSLCLMGPWGILDPNWSTHCGDGKKEVGTHDTYSELYIKIGGREGKKARKEEENK